MSEFVTVAEIKDLEPGQGKVVEVKGRAIALFNIGGTFYALDNTCLHMGGPVGEGYVEGDMVTCPWHGWQYKVETGETEFEPDQKLQTFEVKVEGEEVKIRL